MVSNTLLPNPSTVAMQAQNDVGRYWKLIVTGLINPEDNEAADKKADFSPGIAHYPKMGAYSYTLPSVFEPQSNNKTGLEGGLLNLLQSTRLLLSPGGLAARVPLTSAVHVQVHL